MIDIERLREQCEGPGLFENEGPETPYFWERTGHEDGAEIAVDKPWFGAILPNPMLFELTSEEREVFELDGEVILIWMDCRGFIYSQDFPSRKKAVTWLEEMAG